MSRLQSVRDDVALVASALARLVRLHSDWVDYGVPKPLPDPQELSEVLENCLIMLRDCLDRLDSEGVQRAPE